MATKKIKSGAPKKAFFKAFLKHPGRTGSIIESSAFVGAKLTSLVDFTDVECCVELGSGTGVITRKILAHMNPGTILLAFEIDEQLAQKLREKIRDPRLIIICDSAENISEYLRAAGFCKADCIISTLPLASLKPQIRASVLKEAYCVLAPGANFLQIQYSLLSLRQIKYLFGGVQIKFVALNVPPTFVYVCVKE